MEMNIQRLFRALCYLQTLLSCASYFELKKLHFFLINLYAILINDIIRIKKNDCSML